MAKKKYTEAEKLHIRLEAELDTCAADCVSFIQRWARIENKDEAGTDAGVAIRFKLWTLQRKALDSILCNRLNILLKARQLGVTWLVLACAVWRTIFTPGYTVIALSKTEDDAKELVRRVEFILRHLPLWMVQERVSAKKRSWQQFSGPTWESTTQVVTIYHPGQEPAVFKSMTSAPGSGRSLTANLLVLDEWAFQQWAEEIWSSTYPTVNRPTGGQVIGLSTNKRGSLFESIWRASVAGQNSFARVFLPWWTDPRRTKEWYERTKRDLPHSFLQEYPATPEEALSAGEGTAFPEFSTEIHVCRPFTIPAWWRRWRGNDPGYADPFAWYWFAVSPEGIVYCYREYTREPKDPRVTYSDQAREVVRLSKDEDVTFTVVGRDAWNKVGRAFATTKAPSDGKSIVDCYVEGGLTGYIPPPAEQSVARKARKAIFHEYLDPFEDERTGRTMAKLQIFSTCTGLIDALPNLVVDEKDSEKVAEEPHIYTNPYDAAGYGLIAWHVRQSKAHEPEKSEIQRDKERLAKLRKRRKRIV
ncbi:MAG: hypothetical protein M0P69_08200 [Bacteroidales bacterium]|nr:hypothetical protein [Bacteroidales bacterium]